MPNHGDLILFPSQCKSVPGQPAWLLQEDIAVLSLSLSAYPHLSQHRVQPPCPGSPLLVSLTLCLQTRSSPSPALCGRRAGPLSISQVLVQLLHSGFSQHERMLRDGRLRRAKPEHFFPSLCLKSCPKQQHPLCPLCVFSSPREARAAFSPCRVTPGDPCPQLLFAPPLPFVFQTEGWEKFTAIPISILLLWDLVGLSAFVPVQPISSNTWVWTLMWLWTARSQEPHPISLCTYLWVGTW